MICELLYKRALKRRQFCIPDADIWSGAYRRAFNDAFLHYKEDNEYRVTEYSYGLIVELPKDCGEFLPADIPAVEIKSAKSDTKIKEVFKLCQKQKC